ncbi:MAG TPA: SusD/RagB family nutrient-binding outer membrane lipoprotein [Gemmatimonadaceae bacterium]|nr:SusD/RagB family nutrient-binding outer membrane lipoprotein [Gemmatimonadaceae bacterium]
MTFNRLKIALLAVGAISVTACETDLTDINTNPNSPTTAPATTLFTNATVTTMGRFNGSFQTLSMTSLFAHHVAQVQYVEEDRGRIRPETIDALFLGVYTSELEDYEKVVALGTAANSPNTVGPARVMQSWVFQNITDLWGDIPFTEALKGDIGGPMKPAYDPQEDIYDSLLVRLTEAGATMNPASTDAGLGSADPIYGGDVAQWRKFANVLRARMAMRMQKVDQAKASAELTAAFAAPGGLFTSNADNAVLAWPGDGIFNNPWANNFSGRDDHRMAKTLIDTLLAFNDPRLPIYAQPTQANPLVYAGLPNGMDNTTVPPFFNTTSRPGAIFYPGATTYGTFGTSAGNAYPSNILTYAELCFIQAEAAERSIGGLAPGAAAGFYNAGVTASIEQWGGSPAAATTYLGQAGVTYVGGAAGLQQIHLQKWIALFTQGSEAWSNWRRTGHPSTIVAGPSAYPEGIPLARRLPYPGSEQSVNAEALAAAIARQGADTYATRMWWDQ